MTPPKSTNKAVFLAAARLLVLCCAASASGCADDPEAAVVAAARAWSRGDEAGVYERLTAPSAGMARLLAFADPSFRVVPRTASEGVGVPVVPVRDGAAAVLARLPGARGAVQVQVAREAGAWRIDLVGTEALGRDDGGRGPSR